VAPKPVHPLHPALQRWHGARVRSPARKVHEYAEALGFLALGLFLVLGFGWLAFIAVWAAIAESS
jgi:hypothetical protein